MSANLKVPPFELPAFHPFLAMDVPLLFRKAVEEHGHRPFFVWEPFEGERRTWTYAEAMDDVVRIAGGLLDHGVAPGETVILHFDNSPESLFFWLACSMVGAVAVPTNPRCSGPELTYFADRSQAVGIVAHPQFEDLIGTHLPSIGWVRIVGSGSSARAFGVDRPIPSRAPEPGAPCTIMFSSGTTARPKAILWTQANALWGAMINARHFGLRPDDVTLVHSPLCHTAALAHQALGSLWAGGCIVVQPRFSASRFWDVIVRNKCTWTLAADFVEVALQGVAPPADHALRFVKAFRRRSPNRHIWGIPNAASLAMSETITHTVFSDHSGPVDEDAVGRPSPEYEIRIVRPDGTACDVGETGELLVKGVRGLSLFAGYLGDPDANRDAFTEDGFFRTGDGVTLREDGAIAFVERLKDMLKVGGENVATSAIESLGASVGGCSEIAVVGQPHGFLGEVPYAFVIPQPDAPADLAERILSLCRRELAPFKVPRGIRLVEDLPRSMGGVKVSKATLRRMLKEEYDAQQIAAGQSSIAPDHKTRN